MTYVPGGAPQGLRAHGPRASRAWLWWALLGFGVLSPIGFIIAAAKVRNRSFVRASIISTLLSAVIIIAIVIWPDNGVKPEDAFSVTGVYRGPAPSVYVLGIVWATVAIYALALAPSYNRVIRGLEEERRFFNPPAPGFAPQPAPPRVDTPPSPRKMAPRPAPSAPPPVDSSLADADRYFTTQPGGNMPADFPPNAPQATDAGS